MPTGLIRLITMQKVLKTCSNKSVKQHCLGSNQEQHGKVKSLGKYLSKDWNVR